MRRSLPWAACSNVTCYCPKRRGLPEETGIAALERAMNLYPASGQVTATLLQNVVMTVGELCREVCGKSLTLRMGGLARRLLSIVEMRCGPGVWDECDMAMFSGVLPDMKDHAGCLRTCKVGEVRRRFGMSPLSISAMACLWGEVPAASLKKALRAKYVSILRAVGEAACTAQRLGAAFVDGFEPIFASVCSV